MSLSIVVNLFYFRNDAGSSSSSSSSYKRGQQHKPTNEDAGGVIKNIVRENSHLKREIERLAAANGMNGPLKLGDLTQKSEGAERKQEVHPTPVAASKAREPPAPSRTDLQSEPAPKPPPPLPAAPSSTATMEVLPLKLSSPSCPTSTCLPLITGCGRSGTHFLADQVMKNGVPVKHERIGDAGSVSWIYGAPFKEEERKLETWFASEEDTKKRASKDFGFYPVVHVVRHPLKAITSLVTCFCGCGSMACGRWADEPSWEWAGKFVNFSQDMCKTYRREGLCIGYGVNERKGRLLRAIEYWIGWNDMVGDTSHYRIRMEDYKMEELFRVMDWQRYLKGDGTVKQEGFTRKSKSSKLNEVTWEEIRQLGKDLEEEVWKRAKLYGYGRDPMDIAVNQSV